jgi:hypothetical protein
MILFRIRKFLHPHWFVVTVCTKDHTVTHLADFARCILCSDDIILGNEVTIDWADGTFSNVKQDNISCLLVTR